MIKVSFPPYLIHLDLDGLIDEAHTKATIDKGVLSIWALKQSSHYGLWQQLCTELRAGNRMQIHARRQSATEMLASKDQQAHARAKERNASDQRDAFRQQMALDQAEQARLDTVKQQQKEAAERHVIGTVPKVETSDVWHLAQDMAGRPAGSQHLAVQPGVNVSAEVSPADDRMEFLPQPRARAAIHVSLSHREFPTPQRASKAAEEAEWIMKNKPHLHPNIGSQPACSKDSVLGAVDSPMWLKDKGDQCYKGADYLSAVAAYSIALERSDRGTDTSAITMNRAACYLRLQRYQLCIDDCTSALAMLQSATFKPQQQVRLLARRATAYMHQGRPECGHADLFAAAELDPAYQDMHQQATKAEAAAKLLQMKKEADTTLGNGDISQAIANYRAILAQDAIYVAALSNRAACLCAQGRMEESASDCKSVLRLLQERDVQNGSEQLPYPPVGSQQHTLCVSRTLARLALALLILGQDVSAQDSWAASLALVESRAATVA